MLQDLTSGQERNSTERFRLLLSDCGILGSATLLLYFIAPFVFFPFPSSGASADQIVANVTQYQIYYLLAAWLQVTGTFLIVVFVLGLVYLANAWNRFAAWITMLASAAILILSLNEGIFFLDAAQAIANGHPDVAVTSFDLTFVFLHVFFIAPSLLLPLSFVLRHSSVLRKFFWPWALALGIAFEVLGLVGLFVPTMVPAISILVLMLAWMISAAIALSFREGAGGSTSISKGAAKNVQSLPPI